MPFDILYIPNCKSLAKVSHTQPSQTLTTVSIVSFHPNWVPRRTLGPSTDFILRQEI